MALHLQVLLRRVVVLLVGLATLFDIQPANAISIIVDTSDDENNTNFGACSLREALAVASGTVQSGCVVPAIPGSDDTITVALIGVATLDLEHGALFYSDNGDLTLDGNGLTVDAGAQSRVMTIFGGGTLEMREITLTGGLADLGGAIFMAGGPDVFLAADVTITENTATILGGGLAVQGAGTTITLDGTAITENSSSDIGGGLALSSGAIATISNGTSISRNLAGSAGGGIYVTDTDLTIDGAIINRNEAVAGAGIAVGAASVTLEGGTSVSGNTATGLGGGISTSFFATGVTIREGTTISGNSGLSGGGLHVSSSLLIADSLISGNDATGTAAIAALGDVSIVNSTVSGNTGNGIIELQNASGSIINTTIADNTSTFAASVRNVGGGSVAIWNSILSNTITAQGECSGSEFSYKNSLVQTPGATCVVPPANDNITGVDPLLGGLADNGGWTLTHAILPGSPVVNMGDNALVPLSTTTDQRGLGFPRVQNGTVDMGAYEAVTASLTVQLNLQGRPAPPNSQWVITGDWQIRPQGTNVASTFLSGEFTTNNQGVFVMNGLVTGTYDFWFKGDHTLARLHTVTLNAGSNTVNVDQLREGDADDNNRIILNDFSVLAAAFGTALGNPGFDARVDFDESKTINLVDFSLLASNFGTAGAP